VRTERRLATSRQYDEDVRLLAFLKRILNGEVTVYPNYTLDNRFTIVLPCVLDTFFRKELWERDAFVESVTGMQRDVRACIATLLRDHFVVDRIEMEVSVDADTDTTEWPFRVLRRSVVKQHRDRRPLGWCVDANLNDTYWGDDEGDFADFYWTRAQVPTAVRAAEIDDECYAPIADEPEPRRPVLVSLPTICVHMAPVTTGVSPRR